MLLLLNLNGTGGTLMMLFMISKLMIIEEGTKSINVVNNLNYYQHNLNFQHLLGKKKILTYKTLTFFSN